MCNYVTTNSKNRGQYWHTEKRKKWKQTWWKIMTKAEFILGMMQIELDAGDGLGTLANI